MKLLVRCTAIMTLLVTVMWPSALGFNVRITMRASPERSGNLLLENSAKENLASPSGPSAVQDALVSKGVPSASTQGARPAWGWDKVLKAAAVAAATGCSGAYRALAEYVDPDDVGEVVRGELPPVWVPLAVVGVLTVGIGLLQGSLGDVMNDEAKLGAMSGARAAKQSARDRDMFKKKDQK